MDESLKKVEVLLALFDEREEVFDELSEMIYEQIAPTVLKAITELYQLDEDHVHWHQCELMETMLMIVSSVDIEPGAPVSPFIKFAFNQPDIAAIDDETGERIIRIGIPIPYVFADVEDIKQFLCDAVLGPEASDEARELMSNPTDEPTPTVTSPMHQFDPTDLTEDQLRQMLVHQQHTLGKKH
jgi:hypothetical protein